jgi:hypothetical protein
MDSGSGAYLCTDVYWQWVGVDLTGGLRVSYIELVEMISKLLVLACIANVIASKGLRGSSYNPPIYNHSWTHAHVEPIKPITPIEYTYTDVPYYTAQGYTTEGHQKSTSLRYE